MYELNRDAFHKATPLFDDLSEAQQVLVQAVLVGNHMGGIFVDDLDAPSSALLYAACDFIILVGAADNDDFNRAWHKALTTEILPGAWLFFMDPDAQWNAVLDRLFVGSKFHRVPRYTFELDKERFQTQAHPPVCADYEVRPYDRELAAGADGLAELWGGLDNFLADGLGVAVLHGDEVVSRCHTIFVGRDEAEIGVKTEEGYCRRGLATSAARAFIEMCFERGLRPVWSCWFNNEASVGLAEQLGFIRGPDVPMVIVESAS